VATTGVAGPELDFKPAENRWSIRQIACHLADSEIVDSMRHRLIIAEENPAMGPYDQEAWAKRLDYGKRKLSQALETCRRLRVENYELLKDLPEGAFARTGNHAERGITSLRQQVLHSTEHLEAHVRQIQSVRAAYREHRAAAAAQEKSAAQ